jgi:hypothetical protein
MRVHRRDARSGSDCMFGYLGEDYFRVDPLSPLRNARFGRRRTHLYEKDESLRAAGPALARSSRRALFADSESIAA